MFRRFALAAGCVAALCLPGRSEELPQSAPSTRIAALGVQFPALEQRAFYSPAAMLDIRDNLHASYVRVGWYPDLFKREKIPWSREDRSMHQICASGLKVMALLPSPNDDANGVDDLVDEIGAFLQRYTRLQAGCVRYAEVANEADLPKNGFANVDAYASFYARVAPIVARYGIEVITSGTSGKDLPWTFGLASILRNAVPAQPVSGFGFHPYGVPPKQMASSLEAMRQTAGVRADGTLPEVYVTELGLKNGSDLYDAIVNLAHVTPVITVFEYDTQPGAESTYTLKSNSTLYEAMQRAWRRLHAFP